MDIREIEKLIVSVGDAADILNVSRQTILNRIDRGEFQATRFGASDGKNNAVFLLRDEVLAAIVEPAPAGQ